MQVTDLILPDNDELALEHWSLENERMMLYVYATRPEVKCPHCGTESRRVHSRYVRTLSDLPCSRFVVQLVWCVRRFFCDNARCARVTFAEQLPSVAARYARRTARVVTSVRQVGFVVGGQVGHRVLSLFQLPYSRDGVLRTLRQTPEEEVRAPRVLGIDDWALRKGHTYGTILVDLEEHRVIDVLSSREREDVAQWFQSHPGSEIVARDRGTDYIAGISQGAPAAIQVADRFHLLGNLRDVVQRMFERCPGELKRVEHHLTQQVSTGSAVSSQEASPSEAVSLSVNGAAAPPSSVVDRPGTQQKQTTVRERKYEEVQALQGKGLSQREIGRRVGLNPRTVKKYLLSDTLPPRAFGQQNLSKVLPYEDFLRQRWQEGIHNLMQLWHELKAQGFSGSYASVRRATANLPKPSGSAQVSNQVGRRPLSPRQAAWLLVLQPETLTESQENLRSILCDISPIAATAYALTQTFGDMIRRQRADAFDGWLHQAETAGIIEFKRFAQSLRCDYQAILAALQLPWSNGQTEGQVNRLKLLKRQMYGRANFDLLRRRVLGMPAPT
jgi:transposase